MKKLLPAVLVIRVLFTDCKPGQREWPKAVPEVTQSVSLTAAAEQTVSTIHLLPDTATENMTDSVLSISLEEGGAYVDGTILINGCLDENGLIFHSLQHHNPCRERLDHGNIPGVYSLTANTHSPMRDQAQTSRF